MPASPRLTEILRDWTEVFMRRSLGEFKRYMDNSGLSWPQVNTLMRLHYGGACGVSEVGSHLGVTSAAASQMVERLVQMGLLERTEDPDDRRAKLLALSRKGRALIDKGIEARRAWTAELTTRLSAEQQATIIIALTYLLQAAREVEAPETEKA
jgi:DNA-binding MarR family transcriptional regulator